MRIYWYWPNPHRTVSPYVTAVLRPGDAVTVHALPLLPGDRDEPITEYEVVRTLTDHRDVHRTSPTGSSWAPIRSIARRRSRWEVLQRGYDVAYLGMLSRYVDWTDIGRIRKLVPTLSHVHDVVPHTYRLPVSVERALLRRLYTTAGHLLVYHSVMRAQLVGEFGVDPELVHVLPIPFDSRDHGAVRRPERDRPQFLFFGRLRPNKGVLVLADAVLQLGRDFGADIVIAGGGDKSTTSELHRRLSGLPNVHLELEHISEQRKHELLSRASWLVLPYTSFASQSATVTDGYRYRLPVIASDVGALGPMVRDDDVGLLVPPGDAEALAAAMQEACTADTHDLRRRLDQAARSHDFGVVGPALRAILDRVRADR